MTGTPKQIAWAEKIKAGAIRDLSCNAATNPRDAAAVEFLRRQDDARWWCDRGSRYRLNSDWVRDSVLAELVDESAKPKQRGRDEWILTRTAPARSRGEIVLDAGRDGLGPWRWVEADGTFTTAAAQPNKYEPGWRNHASVDSLANEILPRMNGRGTALLLVLVDRWFGNFEVFDIDQTDGFVSQII